jgi:TonB family protein
MRRRSDDTLSIALCASLIVHVAILFAAFETGVRELNSQLRRPGWSAREKEQIALAAAENALNLPMTEPQHPKPLPEGDPEWGEAGGKGIALNSAPGDKPLAAPLGPQNQSFASRDPKGPAEDYPPEPSMSIALPGQGGDGQRPARDALAGRGTEGSPMIAAPAGSGVPPPPPTIARAVFEKSHDARIGAGPANQSERPASAAPAAPGAPGVGEADGSTIVEAMTHPPGTTDSDGGAHALADIVSAATPGVPETRDALSGMVAPEPAPDLALPAEDRAAVTQAVDSAAKPPPTPTTAPAVARENSLTPEPTPTASRLVLVPKGPGGSAASATGGLPGPPVPPADAAEDTGLESDPFSRIPGVEFHNGKVEARSGRQVKPVRPRLTEAGRRDLLALQFPTILFKVRIDPSGNVQDVKVLRGSGSEAVDMPVYRAMWQWWFEPPKDKQGKPQADVQLVAIHWG